MVAMLWFSLARLTNRGRSSLHSKVVVLNNLLHHLDSREVSENVSKGQLHAICQRNTQTTHPIETFPLCFLSISPTFLASSILFSASDPVATGFSKNMWASGNSWSSWTSMSLKFCKPPRNWGGVATKIALGNQLCLPQQVMGQWGDLLGSLQFSSINLGLEVRDGRKDKSVLIVRLDLWVCQLLFQYSLGPWWVNFDDCLDA